MPYGTCIFENRSYYTDIGPVWLLGAICGSAQSMDRAADPYFAQESMDWAGICGSRLLA